MSGPRRGHGALGLLLHPHHAGHVQHLQVVEEHILAKHAVEASSTKHHQTACATHTATHSHTQPHTATQPCIGSAGVSRVRQATRGAPVDSHGLHERGGVASPCRRQQIVRRPTDDLEVPPRVGAWVVRPQVAENIALVQPIVRALTTWRQSHTTTSTLPPTAPSRRHTRLASATQHNVPYTHISPATTEAVCPLRGGGGVPLATTVSHLPYCLMGARSSALLRPPSPEPPDLRRLRRGAISAAGTTHHATNAKPHAPAHAAERVHDAVDDDGGGSLTHTWAHTRQCP